MLISRKSLYAVSVILLALGFLACTPKRAYRVPEESIVTSIPEIRDDAVKRAEVERHSVEKHPDFALAFIEFDDAGDLLEPAQVEHAESLILEEAGGVEGPGAVIVVFTHGWKHNASVCDENVACFREVLTGLDNLERVQASAGGYEPRRIVGVYFGWRGLSVTPKHLKELTFYARKRTAHRIGEGDDALSAMRRLEEMRNRLNTSADQSRLIIIGHSFGGALTYSAVSSLFEERLASSQAGEPIDGVGDLVVLVNPAFEAGRYTPIHDMSFERTGYDETQPATLVVVTSETDAATLKLFKRGRRLATWFKFWQPKEKKELTRMAVGHYQPYRTHWMEPASSRGTMLPDVVERTEDEARGVSDCRCSYISIDALSATEVEIAADTSNLEEMTFSGVELKQVNPDNPSLNPFLVIGTTDEVVTRHNGIYNRLFIDFLRSFVVQMEARKTQAAAEASENNELTNP